MAGLFNAYALTLRLVPQAAPVVAGAGSAAMEVVRERLCRPKTAELLLRGACSTAPARADAARRWRPPRPRGLARARMC